MNAKPMTVHFPGRASWADWREVGTGAKPWGAGSKSRDNGSGDAPAIQMDQQEAEELKHGELTKNWDKIGATGRKRG